ncbi:MAG: N-acetylmuramic acid 6-phosphate etherase [Candidatus Limnocylindria bacterium]
MTARKHPDISPTERANEASVGLETRSTTEILEIMNREDARVASAVGEQLPAIRDAVDGIVGRVGRGGRLIYLGAGTSGRMATMEAAEAPPTFGVTADIVIGVIAGGTGAVQAAREGAEDDAEGGAGEVRRLDVGAADVLVGVSASGRTPFVLAAMDEARARGALIVGVCCDDEAPLVAASDIPICPMVGPEILAGSTRLKAGTAQKLVLNMMTTVAMIRLGRVHGNLMIDVRPTNAKLRERARRIVAEITGATDSEVSRALSQSDWSARAATLMLSRGLTADEARALLNVGTEVPTDA